MTSEPLNQYTEIFSTKTSMSGEDVLPGETQEPVGLFLQCIGLKYQHKSSSYLHF